jgi:transcription antitermination factor NusG
MIMDFRAVSVGDVVPGLGGGAGGLFLPGPGRWHALRVAPQREDQVEHWLGLRGVRAFHPVLRRVTRRCGREQAYDRRYLPGYVFARFPGEALVHRVLACPWIGGALCRSGGDWGILEPGKMRSIYAMRKLDAAQREAQAAAKARAREARQLRVGDGAMFRAGPLEGMTGEVVALSAAGGATLRLVLFGRENLVPVDAADLVALRKAG